MSDLFEKHPRPKFFFVFDVESVGLHGEGYAYGYVVIDREGNEVASGEASCDPCRASGDDAGRAWIAANCPRLTVNKHTPHEVRCQFSQDWLHWKEQEAVMVADCPWPVEARFLLACNLGWDGPYPLIDVGSVVLAGGGNPGGSFGREKNELPQHDPLCDARQSARILLAALNAVAIADELERLQEKQLEIKDPVARSRLNVVESELIEEREKREQIATNAVREIQRLETQLTAAVEEAGRLRELLSEVTLEVYGEPCGGKSVRIRINGVSCGDQLFCEQYATALCDWRIHRDAALAALAGREAGKLDKLSSP